MTYVETAIGVAKTNTMLAPLATRSGLICCGTTAPAGNCQQGTAMYPTIMYPTSCTRHHVLDITHLPTTPLRRTRWAQGLVPARTLLTSTAGQHSGPLVSASGKRTQGLPRAGRHGPHHRVGGDQVSRHVVQYSGGIGSWAAAHRVARTYGTKDLVLLL